MSGPRSSADASASQSSTILLLLAVLFVAAAATSCGSSGNMASTPKLSGNTSVNLLLSSTANAELSQFDLQFETFSLTNQSGKTVSLISTQQPSELIQLNGSPQPFMTVSVPQDVYTSATATIGTSSFICLTVLPASSSSPGSLDISEYSYTDTPNTDVTVNLPSPITISGYSMSLSLNLLASQSASFASCDPKGAAQFSISPTFNLSPTTLVAQPTNSGNGKLSGLEGEIATISGSGFTLNVPQGPGGTKTQSVTSNSSTLFQGVSGLSSLAVGTFVNMDGAIQSDGSLVATRVAVEDALAVNVLTGPVVQVAASVPVLAMFGREQQGPLVSLGGTAGEYQGGAPYFDFTNSVFQISGELPNLQSLPFVPSFTAGNMVPGQNVDITAPALVFGGGVYTPANTVTLIPQTINASVIGSTTNGGFTVYTVSLANYDIFPTMAVQPGQTTLLTNPGEVQVYVDSNTQQVNTQSLSAGNTLRFYGLVFNDSGTLRMDCAQISDGVSFSPQAKSSSQLGTGAVRTTLGRGMGTLKPTISTVTQAH
jgi:hypothetical protein